MLAPHVMPASCTKWFCMSCRQIDDASYKKLERLFDMAMSDPLNDQDAQPQALIRAKARVLHPSTMPM